MDKTSKVQAAKAKIGNWDYIKLKIFHSKKTIKRMKRQPMEWEKIFASHISDKGLISKIHKSKSKHNKQTNKQTNKKPWASEYMLLQIRHTKSLQVYQKVLNIMNHQENAN